MWKPSAQQSETAFTTLLGLAFASLFFGHSLIHLVGVLFVAALLIIRPRLPWVGPFWWLLAFVIWEWLSNFLGPYHGNGMEGGGIGYHFLFLFLPLCLPVINYTLLLAYISFGAIVSAALIWVQALVGVNLDASPFRINWDGGRYFDRPPGFNRRAWETQFIHSIVSLVVLPHLEWRKVQLWYLALGLFTGVVLPQIRGVIASFIFALGIQVGFMKPTANTKDVLSRVALVSVIAIICIGIVAILRPNFSDNLLSGNGRDKIFIASYEIFKQYPHTGLGGGRFFKEHYQQAWIDLGWHTDKPSYLETRVGHAHSDYLMLLTHHGWPALLLWVGFITHCLIFVWRNGNNRERVLFISIAAMHHIAGLAETYLDYSNTTYAIMLCYGLALHGPVKRFQFSSAKGKPPNS